jgi:hypothetical protein
MEHVVAANNRRATSFPLSLFPFLLPSLLPSLRVPLLSVHLASLFFPFRRTCGKGDLSLPFSSLIRMLSVRSLGPMDREISPVRSIPLPTLSWPLDRVRSFSLFVREQYSMLLQQKREYTMRPLASPLYSHSAFTLSGYFLRVSTRLRAKFDTAFLRERFRRPLFSEPVRHG